MPMFNIYVVVQLLVLEICITFAFEQEITSFEDLPRLGIEDFSDALQQQDAFVMFHAPWCDHCKTLRPRWVELTAKYDPQLLYVVTVDCTTETALCSEENVRGYPTLMFYRQGNRASGQRFTGLRTLPALENFIGKNSHVDDIKQRANPMLDGSVYVLTSKNYLELLEDGDVFVMFYAPWCGHCKKLKPTWKELGSVYNGDEANAKTKIAMMDCTEHERVCEEFKVSGYPTLLYLRNGKLLEKYDGSREMENLLDVVETNARSQPDRHIEAEAEATPSPDETENEAAVAALTSYNFEGTVASTEYLTFVKFYTPWCGHCKRLAPTWELLGKQLSDDASITIAEVDCTEHGDLCKSQQIKGYPTLKLYRRGQDIATYAGDRSLDDLTSFVTRTRDQVVRDEL